VDGEYRPHRAGPAVKEQVTGRDQELGDEEDLRPRRDGFEGRQELAPEQDVYKAYEYYRHQHPNHPSYEALSPFRPARLEGVEYVDPKQLFYGRVDGDPDEQCEQDPLPGIVDGYDGQVGDRLDEDLEGQQPNEELGGPTDRSDIVEALLAPEHDGHAEHAIVQD